MPHWWALGGSRRAGATSAPTSGAGGSSVLIGIRQLRNRIGEWHGNAILYCMLCIVECGIIRLHAKMRCSERSHGKR
jgi:hypothetical protein